MATKNILEIFASNFISIEYRVRFLHDALKKPEKMMNKICHNTSYVFSNKFLNSKLVYDGEEKCLFYNVVGHMEETTWDIAIKEIKSYGNGGYLIISYDGNTFYAESEGESQVKKYFGKV